MISPAPDCARQLEELRAAYARRLPEKVRFLEEGLAAMLGGAWDEGLAREAYRRAHTLVGSSGTYGFSGICQMASTLKSLVRSVLDGSAPCDETFRSRAAALLAILNRAAGRLAGGG